jgi:Tfp pilus assembly protein PilN
MPTIREYEIEKMMREYFAEQDKLDERLKAAIEKQRKDVLLLEELIEALQKLASAISKRMDEINKTKEDEKLEAELKVFEEWLFDNYHEDVEAQEAEWDAIQGSSKEA